jgi:hypothetical protein
MALRIGFATPRDRQTVPENPVGRSPIRALARPCRIRKNEASMEARAPTLTDRVENVRRSLAALPPDADAAQLLHVRLAELERFARAST